MPISSIILLPVMALSGAWMLFVSARDMSRLDPKERASGFQLLNGTATAAARQVYVRFIKRALMVFAGWFLLGIVSMLFAK